MTDDYQDTAPLRFNQQFENGGAHCWPGNEHDAWKLVNSCCSYSSSNEYFASRPFLYTSPLPGDEIDEVDLYVEREKEKAFHLARKWEFALLVTSACHRALTSQSQNVRFTPGDPLKPLSSSGSNIGSEGLISILFQPLQCIGTPLLEMLKQHDCFRGDRRHLRRELLEYIKYRLVDDNRGGQPSFQYAISKHRLSREGMLCCFDLVGIEESRAKRAVEEAFVASSLNPLLNVLRDEEARPSNPS